MHYVVINVKAEISHVTQLNLLFTYPYKEYQIVPTLLQVKYKKPIRIHTNIYMHS